MKTSPLLVACACSSIILGACSASSTGNGSSSSSTSSSSSGGRATAPVAIQLLAFNDLHGHLQPPAGNSGRLVVSPLLTINAGGAAHLAAHINARRTLNPHTMVVSSGDLIGASPLVSGMFHDEPTVEAMNLLGLDLNGVGNHEFDKGADELLRMQNGGCHPTAGCRAGHMFTGAEFQFLAANVRTDNGNGPPLLPAYAIREFEGIPVGFIGMTLEGTPAIVNPQGVMGLRFLDEADTANAVAAELQGLGVEAIVVLLHEGGYTTGTYDGCEGVSGAVVDIAARMDDAVDIILSGHTHRAYNCELSGKLVTSAASFGRLVTRVDVVLDHVTGNVLTRTAENEPVVRDDTDAAMAAFVDGYAQLAAGFGDVIVGSITQDITRAASQTSGISPLGALVADAHLWATSGPESGNAQIAFTNPGGVRADLAFSAAGPETSNGQVRYGEAFEVQPFMNELVTVDLTGAQLRAVLESQIESVTPQGIQATILQISEGFTYVIRISQPQGSRVPMAEMRLNGQPMAANTVYRVTTNSYLAGGGDGFGGFAMGTNATTGIGDAEALVQYFQAFSPVSPPATERLTIQ